MGAWVLLRGRLVHWRRGLISGWVGCRWEGCRWGWTSLFLPFYHYRLGYIYISTPFIFELFTSYFLLSRFSFASYRRSRSRSRSRNRSLSNLLQDPTFSSYLLSSYPVSRAKNVYKSSFFNNDIYFYSFFILYDLNPSPKIRDVRSYAFPNLAIRVKKKPNILFYYSVTSTRYEV
jgi:hypothetical protein